MALTKVYPGMDVAAVDALDLSVFAGEIFGLLGPNGGAETILLTTHYMEEADELCDRLAIMDHGKIAASRTALLALVLRDPTGLEKALASSS